MFWKNLLVFWKWRKRKECFKSLWHSHLSLIHSEAVWERHNQASIHRQKERTDAVQACNQGGEHINTSIEGIVVGPDKQADSSTHHERYTRHVKDRKCFEVDRNCVFLFPVTAKNDGIQKNSKRKDKDGGCSIFISWYWRKIIIISIFRELTLKNILILIKFFR